MRTTWAPFGWASVCANIQTLQHRRRRSPVACVLPATWFVRRKQTGKSTWIWERSHRLKCALHRNSSLEKEDGSYAPAHVLADGRLERAGRVTGASLIRRRSMPPALTRSAGLVIIGESSPASLLDGDPC